MPAYTLPRSSTLTAYQEPPPPLLSGCGHGSLIVWKRQTILPVAADSAYRTPRPPGGKPCVLTYTRPRSTIGAMPTNCSYWLASRRDQSSRPVAASSANAVVSVAP